MFNGNYNIVGAGTSDADGKKYKNVIHKAYFDPAPVKVTIDSFNPATGVVDATVTMFSESDSLSGDHFLLILTEDDISADNTHVTRAVIDQTINLTGAGNTASFSGTFTINSAWDQSHLHVIGIVQRQDKEVVQSGSSYQQPGFSVRAMVPFSRIKIGSQTSRSYQTDDITIINVGQTETFSIRVVIDSAPAGWTVDFSDSTGTTHTGPYSFGLAEQASTTFKTRVTPSSPGYVAYHLEISSPNLAKNLEVPLTFITDDVEVLVVDDDGGVDFENYVVSALDSSRISYGVWDLEAEKLSSAVADSMEILIWIVGQDYPTLDPTDRAFLEQHLDAGKGLFITGQDVGWDLNDSQSGNADVAFYHDYLHADFIRDDVNRYDVDDVPGDPVSDGIMLHIAGGDGADNQEYPSQIDPYDSNAVRIYSYHDQDWGAAIRSVDSTSGARIVYLAFGYEAIDNALDRKNLMRAAILWIENSIFRDDFERGNPNAWTFATP